MKQTRAIFIGVVLCLWATGLLHAGGIYKWTDEDGNVHYGERPPAEGATEVHIRGRGAAEKAETDNTGNPGQGDQKKQRDKMIRALEADRLARQEQKQKKHKEQQEHKMQCAQARDTLRQYKSASSLYKLDAEGRRQSLPESARQNEIKRLQAEIDRWCK